MVAVFCLFSGKNVHRCGERSRTLDGKKKLKEIEVLWFFFFHNENVTNASFNVNVHRCSVATMMRKLEHQIWYSLSFPSSSRRSERLWRCMNDIKTNDGYILWRECVRSVFFMREQREILISDTRGLRTLMSQESSLYGRKYDKILRESKSKVEQVLHRSIDSHNHFTRLALARLDFILLAKTS